MGAVALLSNSISLNVAVEFGLLVVPDKPENDMMGEPIGTDSRDVCGVSDFNGHSQ